MECDSRFVPAAEAACAPNEPADVARLGVDLREALDMLWSQFVDPADVLYDHDGLRWDRLGGDAVGGALGLAFNSESQLREIRNACRSLALTNEFAINGHENRISYIVGTGHAYRVTPRLDRGDAEPLATQAQQILDEFMRVNAWHRRQQEIVRRKDRDGECFLRLFAHADGVLRVRFVEPEQVSAPAEEIRNPAASFGVVTDADDVEAVHGYYVDGRWVEAAAMQHRKANVDSNVKRGLPLLYPVRKNLRRVEKLLRNMSAVAEIQSAIALIRRHTRGSQAGLQQFAQAQADAVVSNPSRGASAPLRRYGPGTILDVLADVEYQFPAAGIDASRYVTVLQAELRAIASRLVMPEFMLTSDASNANYSSTMVAEGPAIKMFERLQQDMLEEDVELLWRVVRGAVEAGRLPRDVLAAVEIRGIPPTLAVRDRLRDAEADRILVRAGAMSVQTMSMRHGLDPQREQQLALQSRLSAKL